MDALSRLGDVFDLEPIAAILLVALVVLRLVLAVLGPRRPRGDGERRRGSLLDWLDAGLLAVALVYLVVRPFVAQVVSVASSSMAPTLKGTLSPELDGPPDRLLVNRFLLRLRPPQRGEVVVFRLDPSNTQIETGTVVKRIIAVGGDTIAIDLTGHVQLNGQPLTEPYAPEPSDRVLPPQRVPAGSVFVLGDNRRHSRDSSRFERSPFVPETALRGKAVAVVWPLGRATLLRPGR